MSHLVLSQCDTDPSKFKTERNLKAKFKVWFVGGSLAGALPTSRCFDEFAQRIGAVKVRALLCTRCVIRLVCAQVVCLSGVESDGLYAEGMAEGGVLDVADKGFGSAQNGAAGKGREGSDVEVCTVCGAGKLRAGGMST